MKIAYISYPTYGGSGIIASEIAKYVANKNNEVFFISYNRPIRLQGFHKNIHIYEVEPVKYPLFKYPPFESSVIGVIVNLAKYEKIDLIHVHYAVPFAMNAHYAKLILQSQNINLPYVLTLHGSDVTILGKEALLYEQLRASIISSDAVTTVSNFLKKEAVKVFNLEDNVNIKTIYNFVDTNKFSPECKDEENPLFDNKDAIVLIHVSNFRKVKRPLDVVRVFQKVLDKKKAFLIFVGDGPERPSVEFEVHRLNMQDNVFFLGKQYNLENIYPLANVFVLTSSSESFGLAALEAMACGLPVVAYDVGGLSEVIDHKINGFLGEYKNTEQLADFITYLANNPEVYFNMSNNAREKALLFSKDKILPQYLELYEQIISN